MSLFLSFFLVILGFLALIYGAHWLINGSSALAKKFKVSDLAIGLTVVAFGTSAPELIVNMVASHGRHSDIVLGNVVGSNNFNLFVILGLSAIINPIKVQNSTAWKEIPASLIATLLIYFLFIDFSTSGSSGLSRLDGLFSLALFAVFLWYIFKNLKDSKQNVIESKPMPGIKIGLLVVFGLLGLIIGGQVVVNNSIEIAHTLGLSEKVIGLTIVAAGTSLPEMVTSVVAAMKKNSDIAVGNVVGSNIFNLLFILALSSLVSPIPFNKQFNPDFYLLIAGTTFLMFAMMSSQKYKLDRWEAAVLLITFLVYTIYLIQMER